MGIGVAHAAGAPSTTSLTTALESALRPEIGVRARSIAGAMRHDGARIAAGRIVAGG
jgi:vancomycin aglycone glucosyltransferase